MLRCELQAIQPAFAIVMIGTNDVSRTPLAVYRRELNAVVGTTEAAGVVPVLSTLPPRATGHLEQRVLELNAVIRSIGMTRHLPVWDLWRSLTAGGMINDGLLPDETHLSVAPTGAAQFDRASLAYGSNRRNYEALEVLRRMRAALRLSYAQRARM